MNRRKFISQTAITSAGIGLTHLMHVKAWSAPVAPSDTLNVALIGCRSMGFGILQHHLSNPGVNCTALCDVDENVLNKRAAEVASKIQSESETIQGFSQNARTKGH